MNKGFVLNTIRRHYKDADKVVVIGFFPFDNEDGRELHAFIDGTEVPMQISVESSMEIRQKYVSYECNVSEEIIALIDVPYDVKSFEIYEEYHNKKKKIYSVEKRKMEEMLPMIDVVIDYVNKDSDMTIVGWAAISGDAEIKIFADGVECSYTMERAYRRDVKGFYPEAEELAEFGFTINIDQVEAEEVLIDIIDGERHFAKKLTIKDYPSQEDLFARKNLIQKTLDSLISNGIKETTKKVYNKVFKNKEKDERENYELFLKQHPVTDEELEKQRNTKFQYEPLISIVIPIYNTPLNFLKELIESIEAQTYSNWQLCLADGSDTNNLEQYVKEYSNDDKRVKYRLLGYNDGISKNTNGAIEIAEGEFIAFSDHDDLLTEDALYEVVKALNTDENIDCVYTDEDKIDMDGETLFMPHFKPDLNIDLLCSYNYITHLFVTRKTLLDEVGWLNSEYDGSQDHDTILRCVEKARRVYHVPKVVYHWRCHKNSTASNPESKMYCYESGRKAVQAHWDRLGVKASVRLSPHFGHYITEYNWDEKPLVSIIIPNMNHKAELETCVNSILKLSTYTNYEILIVENNSTEEEIFKYYEELEANDKVRVVKYEGCFNYSLINNFGVANAKGDYLLFLNNDTELIASDSIKEMLDICMRSDVGAVGARLYYADNRIQHAGVMLGVGGIANHAFYNTDRGDVGYFFRSISVQDLSAVTAACMMTSKEAFESVGGMSEDLAVAFNDVDYCMKLRAKDLLVVYTPFSEWYHYESKSRGYEDTPEKIARLQKESDTFMSRWSAYIEQGDPYYNPNFSCERADYRYDVK